MNNSEKLLNTTQMPLIFIVEDSAAYRILLSRILEKQGFRIMTFEEPAEAVRMLRVFTPNIFISDIEMPVMNGFDLYEAVNNEFPTLNIPFMYISSTKSLEYKARASEIGAVEMLNKPISRETLFSSINRVLKNTAA